MKYALACRLIAGTIFGAAVGCGGEGDVAPELLEASGQSTQDLSLGTLQRYVVSVTAGSNRSDGSNQMFWVRLYSNRQKGWSGYKAINGIARNQTKNVEFEQGASFTSITKIEIYHGGAPGPGISSDGAQLAPTLLKDGVAAATPGSAWVKGEQQVYNLNSDSARIEEDCTWTNRAECEYWDCEDDPPPGEDGPVCILIATICYDEYGRMIDC